LPQAALPFVTFHVEHVIAIQHGGGSEESNLALACDRCNLYKGPNLTAIDPVSGALTPLFHPRQCAWFEHFSQSGFEIRGMTAMGRATVQLLQMNAPRRVALRSELLLDLTST
jgi:hypothetical protein